MCELFLSSAAGTRLGSWLPCNYEEQPGCTLSGLHLCCPAWLPKQAGDYHDTLMLPMVTRLSAPRVRMQPGEFTGYTVRCLVTRFTAV